MPAIRHARASAVFERRSAPTCHAPTRQVTASATLATRRDGRSTLGAYPAPCCCSRPTALATHE